MSGIYNDQVGHGLTVISNPPADLCLRAFHFGKMTMLWPITKVTPELLGQNETTNSDTMVNTFSLFYLVPVPVPRARKPLESVIKQFLLVYWHFIDAAELERFHFWLFCGCLRYQFQFQFLFGYRYFSPIRCLVCIVAPIERYSSDFQWILWSACECCFE